MLRIERLLHALGVALVVFITALAGCGGGGGGGIPFFPQTPQTPTITSGTWTWWVSGANIVAQKGVYGTKGASNIPGARGYAVSWIDASGNLWLFGGFGRDSASTSGELNDLWRFHIQ